jgi:hypothetical protein
MNDQPAAIGVIGGSGLYQIEGLASPKEIRVETPSINDRFSFSRDTLEDTEFCRPN